MAEEAEHAAGALLAIVGVKHVVVVDDVYEPKLDRFMELFNAMDKPLEDGPLGTLNWCSEPEIVEGELGEIWRGLDEQA